MYERTIGPNGEVIITFGDSEQQMYELIERQNAEDEKARDFELRQQGAPEDVFTEFTLTETGELTGSGVTAMGLEQARANIQNEVNELRSDPNNAQDMARADSMEQLLGQLETLQEVEEFTYSVNSINYQEQGMQL